MFIPTLVEQFCADAEYLKGYSKTTTTRYRSNLRLFVRLTNTTDLALVTPEVVRSFFFRGRSELHWSSATFTTYLKSLKVFFRWCAGAGLLSHNPTDGIQRPSLEKKLPPRLTRDEALRLLELIDNYPWTDPFLRRRNHALFSTFIFAGLRKQELLHLRYTDVNIENQTLFVHQGKGRKDRYVPVAGPLAASLAAYHEERLRLRKTCPEFFASLTHNGPLSDTGLRNLIALIVQAFGKKFSAHKLRHTFATLMLEGGCDIYALSNMMGHSDIKTTALYLAATPEHLRGQMQKHPLHYRGSDIPQHNSIY